MAPFLLGVDGGNTKTIALVADATGQIRGAARTGCGDIYGNGTVAALTELDKAINDALRSAGARRDDVASAAFSLAGADWPEDYSFLRTELRQRFSAVSALVLVNDAIGALRAGTSDGVGVSVVCGTGSAIGSRSEDGKDWHASFWGEDLGAASIGHRALRSIVRSELGIEARTELAPRLLNVLGLASVEDLLHCVTRRGARSAPILAGLAPCVLDAAEDGDAAAMRIIQEIGQALGSYASIAARKARLDRAPFTLVLAGGVFRHKSPILREHILAAVPTAHAAPAEFEPAMGTLFLAFDATGLEADTNNIRSTSPASTLFTGETPKLERPALDREEESSRRRRPHPDPDRLLRPGPPGPLPRAGRGLLYSPPGPRAL
jgi:N-acetylglucosamine kinase-like BadF-type ATPase